MNAARLQFSRAIFGAFLLLIGIMPSSVLPDGGSDIRDLAYLQMLGGGTATNSSRRLTPEQQEKALERYKKQKRAFRRLHGRVDGFEGANIQVKYRGYIADRHAFIQRKQAEINGPGDQSIEARLQAQRALLGGAGEEDNQWKINQRIGFLEKQKETAEADIEKAMLEIEGLEDLGSTDGADYEDEYKSRLAEITQAEERIQKSNGLSSPVAHAAIRGLAGEKGWLIFKDIDPESWQQGILAGATYRLAEVAGRKLEETIENELGTIWDTVIGGGFRALKHGVLNGWYWLFHGGDRPFSPEQLGVWKREVLSVVLDGLEKRAREAQKDQSSGRDARMRSLFDAAGGQGGEGQDEELAQMTDPTWESIAQGYAQDLERLALRLEAFKPFYAPKSDEQERRQHASEKSDIIALATRLQETLRLIKDNILMPSGSFKDLASGDMKLFLPQLYKELERRFDLLIEVVSSYHGIGYKKGVKKAEAKKVEQHYHESGSGGGYRGAGYPY